MPRAGMGQALTERPSRVPGLATTVIPVHNRPTHVVSAVESVVAQTYRPIEVVVVDDGSTDGTTEVVDRLARELPEEVRAVHRENGGPGLARESGRVAARGEFIQYLDSDDWIDPRKLEVQIKALRENPGTDIAYCRTLESVASERRPNVVRGQTDKALETIFPALLSGRIWHTITPLYRTAFTDRMGSWTALRQEEDLEYDARAGVMGARLAYCPEMLAIQIHHEGARAGGGSPSDPARMMARFESHRLVFGHARAAGIDSRDENMQRYARELFLLSRQCGAIGLSDESRELFRLAQEASGPSRAAGADFLGYRLMASVVGWRTAGRLACAADSLMPRASEQQR